MHVCYGILATASSAAHSVTISVDDVITLSAFVAAIIAIFGIIFAAYRWYLHQNDQDTVIDKIKKEHKEDIQAVRKEQQLLTYGVLACLEGLKQLNCNGAVTEARDKLSKHLNEQAHRD